MPAAWKPCGYYVFVKPQSLVFNFNNLLMILFIYFLPPALAGKVIVSVPWVSCLIFSTKNTCVSFLTRVASHTGKLTLFSTKSSPVSKSGIRFFSHTSHWTVWMCPFVSVSVQTNGLDCTHVTSGDWISKVLHTNAKQHPIGKDM